MRKWPTERLSENPTGIHNMRYTYDVGGSRLNARPLPGRCAALPLAHSGATHSAIFTLPTLVTLCATIIRLACCKRVVSGMPARRFPTAGGFRAGRRRVHHGRTLNSDDVHLRGALRTLCRHLRAGCGRRSAGTLASAFACVLAPHRADRLFWMAPRRSLRIGLVRILGMALLRGVKRT